MNVPYRYVINPKVNGKWNYVIHAPKEESNTKGTYAGSKGDLVEYLNKTLNRLNGKSLVSGWSPRSAEARRKGVERSQGNRRLKRAMEKNK